MRAPIAAELPLGPLPDTPRIDPSNAWALQRIGSVPGRIYFSPSMKHLQWITEDEILIIDTNARTPIASFPNETQMSFSPDERSMAWVPGDGTVRTLDLTTGAEDLRFEGFSPECCVRYTFSPDGRLMLVADRDSDSRFGSELRLLNLEEGRELFSWDDHDWGDFSPDGSTLGLQALDQIGVTLWDTESLEELQTISGFSTAAPFYGVRFAPDWGSIAFWARAGGDLYDTATGEKRFAFIGEPMRFTPDGRILATSETGWMSSECTGSVCLYDVETGTIRAILSHDQTIWNIEISPDGGLIATEHDNRVRLWDLDQATEVATLHVDAEHVSRVGFSPDGRFLLTYAYSGDGENEMVEIWAVDPAAAPTRIQFEPGATTWDMEESTSRGETKGYALYAFAGQTMQVFVSANGTSLSIIGEDGTVLNGKESRKPFWRGELPLTQDYFIELQTLDRDWVEDIVWMSIAIAPPDQISQAIPYSDPDGYFELEYSDYFAIDPESRAYPFAKGEELLRLAFVGTEFYEGTNLEEAILIIARADDPEIVADCRNLSDGFGQDQGVETINNRDYSKWSASDTGMGRGYIQTAYRTAHAGACYEVIFFESGISLGFLPPSEIVEFDRESLMEKMREVLFALRFTD